MSYFPTTYLYQTRKYDLHQYPKSIYNGKSQENIPHINIKHPQKYSQNPNFYQQYSHLLTDPKNEKGSQARLVSQQLDYYTNSQKNYNLTYGNNISTANNNQNNDNPYSNQFLQKNGNFPTTLALLEYVAFVFQELMKIEVELERCKINLLKQEDYQFKNLFNYFLEYFEQKQENEFITIEQFLQITERFYVKTNPQTLELLWFKLGLNIKDDKLYLNEFAKIFQPFSLEGQKLYNSNLYQKKKELSEETLVKVGRVIKMTLQSLNQQEFYSQQLWDKWVQMKVVYPYLDKYDRGMIVPQDFKQFIEKYYCQEKEFDTEQKIEDVELLLAKFDRIGNSYLKLDDLVHAFIPKQVNSRYQY